MESYNFNLFIIIWLVCFLLTRVGLGKLFKLAGENPVMAWIPVVSWWFWIKVVGRPKWYFIGMLIPCVNILFTFNLCLDILRAFGKNKFWQQFAGIVLTFFYFPILYFEKNLKYHGLAGTKEWRKKNVPKNIWYREWADAILFALYVAGGMRALFFDLYQIPTASMEGNMRVGDNLIVSRTGIGMRIPFTPVAIPILAQKTLPFSQIPGFSSTIQLPYMRLPGWTDIHNNDVVVFNWPADGEEYPIDKKDNYVKRCVGIAGDSVNIIEGQVYINGNALPIVNKTQTVYEIALNQTLTTEFLAEYDLGDCQVLDLNAKRYMIRTWKENAEAISKNSMVDSIKTAKKYYAEASSQMFLASSHRDSIDFASTIDNYGPFYLPKRGDKINLSPQNFDFYARAINTYEKGSITQDGTSFYNEALEKITEYTFKYNYYWMMGDNRYNSLDSRMWGYVPETHVIGKPMFTFIGRKMVQKIDSDGTPLILDHRGSPDYTSAGWRWDKILKGIE